jgi:hypothetical protein
MVAVQGHRDAPAEAAQRLVGGVVDRFLDDVQGQSMRVYIPGRWRTGSSPLRTAIDSAV